MANLEKTAKEYLLSLGYEDAWAIWEASKEEEFQDRHRKTIFSMVCQVLAKGSLSEKQVQFMGTILQWIKESEAAKEQRAIESADWEPVPVTDGRIVIAGVIRSLKDRGEKTGVFGDWKMTIQADEGWKVWGTVPKAIRGKVREGDYVRFTASLKPSDNDPKFGFFSRPMKAELLFSEPVEV
ncbi:hypothetical protein SCBWM1_gp62 [Synechococcus phage S-CBWM1]|uniref:Uncharacterized protein n=1 Tax=Synechococcus phage S-CBWM1 TaxID=2053653 RepID=A0A3G1L3J1_9CAUD|nr:hypothetical protein HOU61_gp135 [Synechococcus phage S-CBWM1]ATW62746.1 hypothetical protein SCBWM1_gp62 [Synechococcus phage S-CBWM1]